jgi:hypothetical protein
MPVVRYVALAALVVWLGSAVLSVGAEWFRSLERVTFVCGAIMLTGLFTMKFVGPPPHDFTIRVVLVALMLAVNTAAVLWGRSNAATAIVLALGFVLLSWYARE